MRHIHNLINITVLATVLVSPAAMAQQQSLTTQVGGLEKHVLITHSGDLSVQPRPCKDNKGRPKICTCTDRDRLSKADQKPAQKKANPCNPKKGEPVDPKACRDYILKGWQAANPSQVVTLNGSNPTFCLTFFFSLWNCPGGDFFLSPFKGTPNGDRSFHPSNQI